LPESLRSLLVERYFHDPFPSPGVDDLLAALDHVRLGAGETLLRQGETGNDLFLVIDGYLSVCIDRPDELLSVNRSVPAASSASLPARRTGDGIGGSIMQSDVAQPHPCGFRAIWPACIRRH
jgi:hypothetical protein